MTDQQHENLDRPAEPVLDAPNPMADNLPAPAEAALPAEATPVPPAAPAPVQKSARGSFAGGTWTALVVGALLLILLLIFILQNQTKVDVVFFVWEFTIPAGVGFLLAAIAGALIMAMVGAVRMFQLRRQVRKALKNQT